MPHRAVELVAVDRIGEQAPAAKVEPSEAFGEQLDATFVTEVVTFS
jgi:hypothetical protein